MSNQKEKRTPKTDANQIVKDFLAKDISSMGAGIFFACDPKTGDIITARVVAGSSQAMHRMMDQVDKVPALKFVEIVKKEEKE
jgi:hypothetical protein